MVASRKEEDPLVTPDFPRESSVGEFCCKVPIGRVTRGVDGDDCGRRRLVSDGELVSGQEPIIVKTVIPTRTACGSLRCRPSTKLSN